MQIQTGSKMFWLLIMATLYWKGQGIQNNGDDIVDEFLPVFRPPSHYHIHHTHLAGKNSGYPEIIFSMKIQFAVFLTLGP